MRIRLGIFTILLVLLMTGCISQAEEGQGDSAADAGRTPNPASVEVREGDFVYRLVTKQSVYKGEEAISIYAELEYVGQQESVTVYHAASPFYFPMTEHTRGYDIHYAMEQPLISTVLKREEPLRKPYIGSGGYSGEDPEAYKAFMQELQQGRFPAGSYTVFGMADFYLEPEGEGQGKDEYQLRAQVDYQVVR